MSLGTTLEVAISLALIYALLSLVATTLTELAASVLRLRAKTLRTGITSLLQSGQLGPGSLADKVFGHALVQGTSINANPTYLQAGNFARALIDTVADGSSGPLVTQVARSVATMPDSPAKQALGTFLNHAGGDLDALRTEIETWFDGAMDRLSGTYKRRTQWIGLGLGLALAVVMNVDSLQLAITLWRDEPLRGALVKEADAQLNAYQALQPAAIPPAVVPAPAPALPPPAAVASPAPSPPAHAPAGPALPADAGTQAYNTLMHLALPIGWSCPGPWSGCPARSSTETATQSKSTEHPPQAKAPVGEKLYWTLRHSGWGIITILFGWTITALAISLGATFWFDTLQSLINIRNAGPKPASSTQQGGP